MPEYAKTTRQAGATLTPARVLSRKPRSTSDELSETDELSGALAGLPAVYRGAVKLVACYSGSLVSDGKKIEDPDTNAPIDKTFAASLAQTLAGKQTEKFQPTGVEGIAGIAWVDEITGQKTGLDVLGEDAKEMNPAERLYTDETKVKGWFAAMQETDPGKRRARMEASLEGERQKGEETLPTRRIGKGAKRWFPTG